jgi:integrase
MSTPVVGTGRRIAHVSARCLASTSGRPRHPPVAAGLVCLTGAVSRFPAVEGLRAAAGGWTLHQLRHSRLTHLAEAGVTGPLLMAKSRHGSVKALAIYANPTFGAVAGTTARLDRARRRLDPGRGPRRALPGGLPTRLARS